MSGMERLNLEALDRSRIKDFQKLMRFKVRDILRVPSLYDQYRVNSASGDGFIDRDWLTAQEPRERVRFLRHLRSGSPLRFRISGHQNRGIILKPSSTGTP